MRAKEGGKETTGGRLRLPSVPFPWSLAVHHQSLAFRARLCHAKNEAPEEEAASDVQGGMTPLPLHSVFENFIKKILSGHLPISVAVRLSWRPIYCEFFVKVVLYIRKIKTDEGGVLYGLILKDTKELRL